MVQGVHRTQCFRPPNPNPTMYNCSYIWTFLHKMALKQSGDRTKTRNQGRQWPPTMTIVMMTIWMMMTIIMTIMLHKYFIFLSWHEVKDCQKNMIIIDKSIYCTNPKLVYESLERCKNREQCKYVQTQWRWENRSGYIRALLKEWKMMSAVWLLA